MNRKAVYTAGVTGFVIVVIAALAYMLYGMAANYSANHGRVLRTFSIAEAANSRYDINLVTDTGIQFKLPGIRHDNYVSLCLSPNDTYQIAFYGARKKNGSFVVDSGPWAALSDAAGLKPILHLIPPHIVAKGFDTIIISPLRGDGDYVAANLKTHRYDSLPSGINNEYNVIDFEIKQMEIEISKKSFEKIQKKRDEALKVGILLTEDSDVVPAKIIADGHKFDSEIRLKGDWTDHLGGNKWSFRIELNGDNCAYGMQKFSVQPPETRYFIHEYLMYAWYRELGGVALRYDFIDIYVNGEYKGVYALEEFMEKRVIEYSQKREGPIVKQDENITVWEPRANYINNLGRTKPAMDKTANQLIVFSEKKTLSSEILSGNAQYAIDYLNRFLLVREYNEALWNGFDYDLFAKLMVICDLFQSMHGRTLHNNRFYNNPVTSKLEPIPFDEIAMENKGFLATLFSGGAIDSKLFNNVEFRMRYKRHAREIFEGAEAFLEKQRETLRRYETIISRDYYGFTYNTGFIADNIAVIKTFFDPQVRAAPSANIAKTDTGYNLKIVNNNPAPIIVTSLTDQNGNAIAKKLFPVTLSPKLGSRYIVELIIPETETVNAEDLEVTYQYYYDDAGRQYSGEVEEGLFSFYAVGHFYGSGERDAAVHPHPAFVNYVPTIANNKRLDFGVLLGDIVISPSRDNYNAVIECMEKTGKPYYAIPGNHDGEGRGLSLFEGYFGKSERYFRYKNNLFILLNPIYTRVEAIIGEEGLKMIQSALVENRTVHNIFVFTHELIWLDRERPGFKDFYANMIYDPSFAQQFYETVLPMFDTVSADVYFIAGDAGKYNNGMELFYGKNDGITYIATGLGSNTKDNILQFDVTTSGEVFIQLIALNGTNPNALGHIEDYAR